MSSPVVSKVSPSNIGVRGGAITIEGAGFSEDVFNQFDPVLGNKVEIRPDLLTAQLSPLLSLLGLVR